MCYCNCPHEDINGCCREDECTFVKNGMTPPKVVKTEIKNEGYCGLAGKEGAK